MYIEDIIKELVSASHFITANDAFYRISQSNEFEILVNMSDQLEAHGALTERQSVLALRILNSYSIIFKSVIKNINEAIEQPKWHAQFRSLEIVKLLSIESRESTIPNKTDRIICARFPYNAVIAVEFRSYNSAVHDLFKGKWNVKYKRWEFILTEKSIIYIGSRLLPEGFIADEEFAQYYTELMTASKTLEQKLPMLSVAKCGFEISNGHSSIPKISSNDVVEAAYIAKKYGITVYDDEVTQLLQAQCTPVTKKILASSRQDRCWFDSRNIDINSFSDLIKSSGKILILVTGNSELAQVKQWTNLAHQNGIDYSEISVMFRLPSEKAAFNNYVREVKIDNSISANTKLVFVSTKISKPLIKSGIKFDTVINLGYYDYMHFSIRVLIDSICNLVFYSMEKPRERSKWQTLAL